MLWCLSQAATEIDSHGSFTGYVGAFTDISDRQRAQETERALGNLLENSLNEIYIFDADTLRFVEVNRGARENLGSGPLSEHGVRLEIEPDLPKVQGDRMRLLVLFQNLVENAVKFMGD